MYFFSGTPVLLILLSLTVNVVNNNLTIIGMMVANVLVVTLPYNLVWIVHHVVLLGNDWFFV
jgi:hypothetical protein